MLPVVEKTKKRIQSMEIRGALTIAIAAAEAIAVVVAESEGNTEKLRKAIIGAGEYLRDARPTAVSLPNAIDYIQYLAEKNKELGEREYRETMLLEIESFITHQRQAVDKIAEYGSHLLEDGNLVLTHCNSDTALAVIKKAFSDGRKIEAICTETRPRHQGYISARELANHGIPTKLIIDSAVYYLMHKLEVDKVIVGADAISASGDVVNKIGTSQVALAAQELDIEFYVAAESLKFSPETLAGKIIPIEERSREEITSELPPEVEILNPVFDITPHRFINSIITEYGVIPPQAAYQLLREHYSWKFKEE